VITDVALRPSLKAVIIALPVEIPVTRPLVDTVATLVFELPQVMARSDSGFPEPSRGVAVSDWVAPIITVAVAGVSDTEATGIGVTLRVTEPVLLSLVALMVD
jgi:hypothetical protein